jgi:hypothetical protein
MANEREITLYFLEPLKAHYGKGFGPGMAASLAKSLGPEVGIEALERATDIVIQTRKGSSFPDMPACIAAIKRASVVRRVPPASAFGESAPRPALVRTAKEIEQAEWQRQNLPWNGPVPIPRFPKRPPMPRPGTGRSLPVKPPVDPQPQAQAAAEQEATRRQAPEMFLTGSDP